MTGSQVFEAIFGIVAHLVIWVIPLCIELEIPRGLLAIGRGIARAVRWGKRWFKRWLERDVAALPRAIVHRSA